MDARQTPHLDRDLLISRLIDGRAVAADWSAFRDLVGSDPALWSDLLTSRRADEALVREVALVASGATAVRLDPPPLAPLPPEQVVVTRRAREGGRPADGDRGIPLRRAAALGWSVAAVLALGLGTQVFSPRGPVGDPAAPPVQGAGLGASGPAYAGAEQAFRAFMDLGRQEGRVVGELPASYVLESRPAPDGRYEVLYVRQIIERRLVDSVVGTARDEQGRPVLVPMSPPTTQPGLPGL